MCFPRTRILRLAREKGAELVGEALALGRDMFLFQLGQLAEELFLAPGQLPGRLHHQLDEKVTLAAAAQAGHAPAGDTQHLAALDAAFQGLAKRAIERRHLDVAAEGGLADRDRHLADQMVAVPLKERMRPHVDAAVPVAAAAAAIASLALPTAANGSPVIDAGRDGDFQAAVGQDAAVAAAWKSPSRPASITG